MIKKDITKFKKDYPNAGISNVSVADVGKMAMHWGKAQRKKRRGYFTDSNPPRTALVLTYRNHSTFGATLSRDQTVYYLTQEAVQFQLSTTVGDFQDPTVPFSSEESVSSFSSFFEDAAKPKTRKRNRPDVRAGMGCNTRSTRYSHEPGRLPKWQHGWTGA
jgi:hypothetical protein